MTEEKWSMLLDQEPHNYTLRESYATWLRDEEYDETSAEVQEAMINLQKWPCRRFNPDDTNNHLLKWVWWEEVANIPATMGVPWRLPPEISARLLQITVTTVESEYGYGRWTRLDRDRTWLYMSRANAEADLRQVLLALGLVGQNS